MGLLSWISHCYNGIIDFGVNEDGMKMLVIPSLLPEAHDLSQLLLCIVLYVLKNFEFLSHFFLQAIDGFKRLTFFHLFRVSDV